MTNGKKLAILSTALLLCLPVIAQGADDFSGTWIADQGKGTVRIMIHGDVFAFSFGNRGRVVSYRTDGQPAEVRGFLAGDGSRSNGPVVAEMTDSRVSARSQGSGDFLNVWELSADRSELTLTVQRNGRVQTRTFHRSDSDRRPTPVPNK